MNEAPSEAALVSWKEEPRHTRRSPLLLGVSPVRAGRGAGGTVRAVWRDAPQCRPFLFSWSCVEIHGIYFLKPFVSLFTQVTKQLILSWVEPGPCLSYIEILRQITHEHSRRAAYLQTIETVSICK